MYRVSKATAGIGLGVLTAASLVAQAGVVHSWDSAANGFWNEGFRWDTGVVPGSFDGAILGNIGAYAVTLSASDSVGLLDVANPDATLGLFNAQTLTINGALLKNNGQIVINSNFGGSTTSIFFGVDCLLDGTGALLLTGPGSRVQSAGGTVVTQSALHTIQGQGQIESAMMNGGVVRANITGQELRLVTNSITNNLLMEAVDGARLDIASITVTQGVNGVIHSEGFGSEVDLSAAAIVGGSLTADLGGRFVVSSSSVLDSVFKSGDMDLQGSQTLTLRNSFVNEGLLILGADAGASDTILYFEDSMILQGHGSVLLSRFALGTSIQTGPGAVLTIPENQSISGSGQIEAAVTNNGLIQANNELDDMRLITNPKVNTGIIEAIDGGRIDIDGITISQFAPGVIRTDDDYSQVKLSSATINGGDLESDYEAGVVVVRSSTLDGVSFRGYLDIFDAQTLSLSNSFSNDGLITINSDFEGSGTTMVFNHSMTLEGSGSVLLNGPGSQAGIQTLAGVTLTIPATQTILGEGQIEGVIINNGLIQADVDGSEMRLLTNAKTNNSVIEAINESRIDITGITINQGVGGVIRAEYDSQIELSSATIVNGELDTDQDGTVEVLSSSTLDGVVFSGYLNLLNAQTLNIANSFTNNGVIFVNSNEGENATTMVFEHSMTLEGAGTIVLNQPGTQAGIQTLAGATLTIPPSQGITGNGQIEGSIINNGLIQANSNGEIRLITNPKTNNSWMMATDESRLDINGIEISQGLAGIITSNVGSTVELSSCTITGGRLRGEVHVASSSILDGVWFSSGTLNLWDAQTLTLKTGLTNDGLIVVNSDSGGSAASLVLDDPMTIGGDGTIRLNSIGSLSRLLGTGGLQGEIGTDQRLEGIGQIGIDLVNSGTIAPGLSVGTMVANQPVLFGSGSHFEAEINEVSGDLLDSSSTVEVHGTLDVLFVDGFAPAGFWSRTIIEGADITGMFDAVNAPPAPDGLVTKVHNTGTELIVGQTCAADLTLDGVLDFFDISSFLTAFTAMDPSADFSGDGEFDFFDISAFLSLFSTGCS